jgi:hypothetical protein
MNSRARPPFTNEQHKSEAQEDDQILQLCDGEDEEQLQNFINDIQHEGEAQFQWDNFLTTILESSFNRSFAPPQNITPPTSGKTSWTKTIWPGKTIASMEMTHRSTIDFPTGWAA